MIGAANGRLQRVSLRARVTLLAAFGVDFAVLWGFLTFVSHYIPHVGAIVSVGLPTVFGAELHLTPAIEGMTGGS
mgnify:CR=1 FL=1